MVIAASKNLGQWRKSFMHSIYIPSFSAISLFIFFIIPAIPCLIIIGIPYAKIYGAPSGKLTFFLIGLSC